MAFHFLILGVEAHAWVATGVVYCLTLLGVYLLLSAIDDCVLDLLWLIRPRNADPTLSVADAAEPPERIALFLPLWQEASVIGDMVRHTLSVIDDPDFDVFAGAYPNDAATLSELRLLEARYPKVHIALVPHDGPTSKADCLNWIYQQMVALEETRQCRFEIIVIHDAEDLIAPESMRVIRRYARQYDMMQVPVLALPTPWSDITHGIYCDDFAESQCKDLETRVWLGAFLPGCGVGTAFRRDMLEKLAEHDANRIFRPDCLTEDYDIGFRVRALGGRQAFIPVRTQERGLTATREYFPRSRAAAVRQRSRWVTGNSIQAWERYGWGRNWRDRWFLWRDRKGLWGNPISLFCNLLLLYGAMTFLSSCVDGSRWELAERIHAIPWMESMMWATTFLMAARLTVRATAVASVYGWWFAAGVPLRLFWGNWINCHATVRALTGWVRSRISGEPISWLKTQHHYPNRATLQVYKLRLGEILVANGYCGEDDVQAALAMTGTRMRLGERLMAMGVISEQDLYEALSLQQSIPCVHLDSSRIPQKVSRTLPSRVQEEMEVLPFQIADGGLFLACPEVPNDEMQSRLQRYTRLELRFHLIPQSEYHALREQLAAG